MPIYVYAFQVFLFTCRCILLEFVSSLVVGADEALVNMLFDYVKAVVWVRCLFQSTCYCSLEVNVSFFNYLAIQNG